MAFDRMTREHIGAAIITSSFLNLIQRQLVADLALRYLMPTTFVFRGAVEAGGLMSYGVDVADIFRHGAIYVDKILKGAKPADLPIEQPTRFEFVINLKTAKALGLTIPPSLLLHADAVIE
jgi:putative ABC transport system substrate-binding protein